MYDPMNPFGQPPNPVGVTPVPSLYRQPMNNMFSQSLIRVNGMDSAKAYPTQPNSMYALFDENDDIMYIKQTDASNFPTIKRYRFTEEAETVAQPNEGKYVTVEEFNKFKEELLNGKQPVRNNKSKWNGDGRNSANKGNDANGERE